MVILLLFLLLFGVTGLAEGYNRSDPISALIGLALLALSGLLIWWSNWNDSKTRSKFAKQLADSRLANPVALLDFPVAGSSNKRLVVTRDKVIFGDKTINTTDVVGISFCNSSLDINGSTSAERWVELHDGKDKTRINCCRGADRTWHHLTFDEVFAAISKTVGAHLLQTMLAELAAGKTIKIGRVELSSVCVLVHPKLFFMQPDRIEWQELSSSLRGGKLELFRNANSISSLVARIRVQKIENGLLLCEIVSRVTSLNNQPKTYTNNKVQPSSKPATRSSTKIRELGIHPEDGNPIIARLDEAGRLFLLHNGNNLDVTGTNSFDTMGLNQAISLLAKGTRRG
jgi:hypothetical protein